MAEKVAFGLLTPIDGNSMAVWTGGIRPQNDTQFGFTKLQSENCLEDSHDEHSLQMGPKTTIYITPPKFNIAPEK